MLSPLRHFRCLAFAAIVAGCAHQKCPLPVAVDSVEPLGRVCARGEIQVEADQVGPPLEAESLPPPQYRAFTPAEVQCFAATNNATSQLIDMEWHLVAAGDKTSHWCKLSENERLQNALRIYRALRERNQVSAQALRVFYGLAEAEARSDFLRETSNHLQQAISDTSQMKERGLEVDVDLNDLLQQRYDAIDQNEQLKQAIQQFNHQLRHMLAVDPHDETPIWPDVVLEVAPSAPPLDEAVATAFALRADLGIVRLLSIALNKKTLNTVRGALTQIDASLGSRPQSSLCRLLDHCREDLELQTRQVQLIRILEEQEKVAAKEIETAIESIATSIERVALAKRSVDLWITKVDDLERKQSAGEASPSEVVKARIELISARVELMHQAVAWQLSWVQLKEAAGLLAVECNYHGPTWDPCDHEDCGGCMLCRGLKLAGVPLEAPRPPLRWLNAEQVIAQSDVAIADLVDQPKSQPRGHQGAGVQVAERQPERVYPEASKSPVLRVSVSRERRETSRVNRLPSPTPISSGANDSNEQNILKHAMHSMDVPAQVETRSAGKSASRSDDLFDTSPGESGRASQTRLKLVSP